MSWKNHPPSKSKLEKQYYFSLFLEIMNDYSPHSKIFFKVRVPVELNFKIGFPWNIESGSRGTKF
jgi:hypothetical protein